MANDPMVPQRSNENQSYFAQRLASDAELARRCEEVANKLRAAAADEIKAVERSERLTSEDFAVYINARADVALDESK
jgi:hypothetical protein